MEVNTGHLVRDLNSVPEEKRHLYTPIPAALFAEADRELDGLDETYVNPNRAVALAAWANNRKRKGRAKAKLAKASRKRNRTT